MMGMQPLKRLRGKAALCILAALSFLLFSGTSYALEGSAQVSDIGTWGALTRAGGDAAPDFNVAVPAPARIVLAHSQGPWKAENVTFAVALLLASAYFFLMRRYGQGHQRGAGYFHAASFASAFLIVMVPAAMAYNFPWTLYGQDGLTDLGPDYFTVSWSIANQSTTGKVSYGKTESLDQSASSGESANHTLNITGLDPDTKYYYKIEAKNSTGYSEAVPESGFYTLITKKGPDITAPNISDIKVAHNSNTSVTITWTTDETSNSSVHYGISTSLGSIESDNASVTGHSIALDNLTPTQLYYYRVRSCDALGNCYESGTDKFVAIEDTGAQYIQTNIRQYHNTWAISFSGKTKPFAEVRVYVNDQWTRFTDADANGDFSFSGVGLSKGVTPNKVTVASVDQSGNMVSQDYLLYPDFVPPVLNVTNFPPISTSPQITIVGFVNELCTVAFSVRPEPDTTVPQKVSGLNSTAVYTNSVELSWNAVNNSDLLAYAVYRDDLMITTTTSTTFIDSALDSGKSYKYKVSAFDNSCNEGEKSSTLAVTTAEGGGNYSINATQADFECSNASFYKEINISGKFAEAVELKEGNNHITVNATDMAGSFVYYKNSTYYDASPPKILWTNLENYRGVTYDRDIVIRGNVSENATINIYINNDTSPSATGYTVPTDNSSVHNFEVEVTLKRDILVDANSSNQSVNGTITFRSGAAWENNIRLEAVDIVGQTDSVNHTLIYTLCSVGSWFRVTKTPVTPTILTPRLIIMGMQQMGIGINISWQGSTSYNATITGVDLVPQVVNVDDESDWDLDWVSGMSKACNKKKTECWLSIKLKEIDPSNGQNWTWYQKEENISNHRKGECVTIPDVGCVRLPLMLEIKFETPMYNESFTQKECWDLEIGIDERINPDVLPEKFLSKAVRFLDKVVDTIDKILEPLKKIEEAVLYACLASWALLYVKAWSKRGQCEMKEYYGKALEITGQDGTFHVTTASYGKEACVLKYPGEQAHDEYCGDENEMSCENCQSCAEAIQSYKDVEQKMQWLCDRMFCPTAPTFKKHVKDTSDSALDPLTNADILKTGSSQRNTEPIKTTDCALASSSAPDNYFYGSQKEPGSSVYVYYAMKEKESQGAVDCEKLHVPNALCCPQEYMLKYDSVCGLPDGKMFNELKESACIEAQERRDGKSVAELECNVIWNAVAGFCDPEGMSPANYIPSNIRLDSDSYGNDAFLYMKVVSPESSSDGAWIIEPGHVKTELKEATDAQKNEKHDRNKATEIQQHQYFRQLSDSVKWEDYFVAGNSQQGQLRIKEQSEACGADLNSCSFCTDMASSLDGKIKTGSEQKLHNFCKDVHAALGSGKDQVVDPTSGLLRSAQCLCLPGFKSYLSFYRAMAVAVRNCFQTILMTGDGSSGMCQAVLTVYVCDLIWDMIRCFKEKFKYSNRGKSQGGFGSIVSQITGAGEDVGNSISSRYGDTQPWQAMFGERKVVHALCLWAFTGTWDLDFTSFFESNFSVPIESQGMLFPCERRFVSFDPSSSPKGKATYQYHIGAGLVAGADLTNVHIDLICSNGICDTSAGYSNGLCDCRTGSQSINSGWPGIPANMKAGEVLSEDIYVQHAGYRYDRAALSWAYVNNQGQTVTQSANCTIKKVGPDEPAYCEYSLVHGMYVCSMGGDDNCTGYFESEPSVRDDRPVVGDELEIDASITHGGSQGSGTNMCTKFVDAKLVNAETGNTVKSLGTMKAVNHEGTDDVTFKFGKIEESWMGGAGTSLKMVDGSGGVITGYETLAQEGVYKIQLTSATQGTCWKYKDLDSCNKGSDGSTLSLNVNGDKATCDGNTYKIDNQKLNTKSNCIVIEKQAGGSASGCSSNVEKKKFRAEFTMYDAVEHGTTWRVNENQVTYYNDEKQKKSIEFSIYCRKDAGSGDGDGDGDSADPAPVITSFKAEYTNAEQTSPFTITSGEIVKFFCEATDDKTGLAVSVMYPDLKTQTKLDTNTNNVYSGSFNPSQTGNYSCKAVDSSRKETTFATAITITVSGTSDGSVNLNEQGNPTEDAYFCSDKWVKNACTERPYYEYKSSTMKCYYNDTADRTVDINSYTPSTKYNWKSSLDNCNSGKSNLVFLN